MVSIKELQYTDVAVCGGGPAGIGAAAAAADAGLSVTLIEATGCLGGTSTSGGLPMMLGYTNGSVPFPQMVREGLRYSELPHPRRAVGGIFEKLTRMIVSENGSKGTAHIPQTDKYPGLDRLGCHDEFIFDMETGKRVFDGFLLSRHVKLRYYARVIDVKRTANRIEGVYFADKSGISYQPAGIVVDCTGDADCVYQAGFETVKGDPDTGTMAIAGLVAHVENVDSAEVEKWLNSGKDPWFRPLCEKAQAEHPELDLPSRIIMFPMPQPGVFMINGGLSWGGYDGTDGESLTALTVRGRKEADKIVRFLLREYFPGFKNAVLRSTAAMPGIRETRRIVSEGALTENALLMGNIPADTVALGGRHFDLQRRLGQGSQVFAEKGLSVKNGITAIPYSAMIPRGADNIIAAGRCIDAQGQALGPVRVMSTCMALGEAAGTAAFLAAQRHCTMRDVDTDQLRDLLRRNDAEIDV